jgi:hypothetical protein
MSYTENFTAAKLAARDELRTAQVARRLDKVSKLNHDLKNLDEEIVAINESSEIARVEADFLPTAHPRRAKTIEIAAKTKEYNDKEIACIEKSKIETQKDLDEVKAEIADIEAENKKVDREPMIERAKELIKKSIEKKFLAEDYDADAKKALAAKV